MFYISDIAIIMSRPSSRRGKAGKKKGAKTPKKQIAELTEQNAQLTEQLDSTRLLYQQLQSKMDIVTDKLVNSINKRDFCISDKTDLTQLTADVLTEMIEKLVVKKKIQVCKNFLYEKHNTHAYFIHLTVTF